MKVCGFSFIKNAIKFQYPVIQSIQSILPLCDHFVIAVGASEDNTLDHIKSIGSNKIEIIETVWDDNIREGGKVLAIETNKAFDAIKDEYDWCIYIQGDEIIHEKYYPVIIEGMELWKDSYNVEGLLFKYLHFWGTYDYIGDSSQWYRNEIRIIRNDKSIRSYLDAQGFRKNGKKLKVKPLDAYVYHYGWVRRPEVMMDKIKSINKLWHNNEWVEKNIGHSDTFDYSEVDSLALFTGTHPLVMQSLISELNWHFKLSKTKQKLSLKQSVVKFVENLTGVRLFEYKNYKVIP